MKYEDKFGIRYESRRKEIRNPLRTDLSDKIGGYVGVLNDKDDLSYTTQGLPPLNYMTDDEDDCGCGNDCEGKDGNGCGCGGGQKPNTPGNPPKGGGGCGGGCGGNCGQGKRK